MRHLESATRLSNSLKPSRRDIQHLADFQAEEIGVVGAAALPDIRLIPDPLLATVDVSIVIPALNEARNIPYVFERIPPEVFEVILVDGHSTDGTVDVAKRLRPNLRVIPQTRRGKGNALACGFWAARGDIIVMLDADGSTDPAEIPRFAAALLAGADFAKGSRFIAGGGSADLTTLRRIGNRTLAKLVNAIWGGTTATFATGTMHSGGNLYHLSPPIATDSKSRP